VEELHEEMCSMRPHGSRDPSVAFHDLGEISAERVCGQQPAGVDRRRLEHDQADAAAGTRLVVGDEVVVRQVVVDERRLMRRRDDPVRKLDRPDP
jgi:hypothetical protein